MYNHREGKDKEIVGMNLNINAIETCMDIPECMSTEEMRHTTQVDDHLNALTMYVIHGPPSTRADVKEEIQPYGPF